MTPKSKFNRLPLTLLLVLGLLLLPASVQAAGFSLFGSYWDTDALGDTVGAGLIFAIPLGDSGLDLDLRASYYEDLEDKDFDDVLDDIFDDDLNPLVENSIEVIPLEIGLKYNFVSDSAANFYLGGGGGYYLLDNTGFAIDDEFGFYAVAGFTVGDSDGAAFMIEAIYRKIEGSVENDPRNLNDVDDLDFTNNVDLDLDGVGVNAGVIFRW